MSIDIIDLQGTPEEMGRQHGELLADGARAMCETRMELCLAAAANMSRGDLLALAGQSLPAFAEYAPDTYAEFRGIAEGAGLSCEELLIGNGYTDLVDLVRRVAGPSECTSCAVLPEASAEGNLYVGQTWDMNAGAFPHVVAFRRRPVSGPATLTLTTAGCLALIGLNEHGIAVGNTNLTPADAKHGVMYLAILHTALAQETHEAAVRAITDAPRMSGHYYYVGGPDGELAAIETSGERHSFVQPGKSGLLAHANHYNDPEMIEYVGQTAPSENSLQREARMWDLLRADEKHDMASLWSILGDHETPICRHASEMSEVRTCAAVMMSPGERLIRMTKGNPCECVFVEATVA